MTSLIKSNGGQVSPWKDFNVDNFFDNSWMKKFESRFPAVNISENDKNYSIEVVAPGFKKEDFKLKVEDDILTISAEAKSENVDENKRKEYTRREYSYSSFTCSFHLPDNVKDDSIAVYRDGVLQLDLPKSKTQAKATKEISIN